MPNFYNSFNRGFERGAQRGVQQFRFNQKQEAQEERFNKRHQLQKRAQAVREKQAEAEIERINQELSRLRKMTPHEVEAAKNRADTTEEKAEQAEIRTDRLPGQLDQQAALNSAKEMATQARANMLSNQAQKTAAQLKQYRRQRRQRQENQKTREMQQQGVSQMQPVDLPETQEDPVSIGDVPRALHNYTTGPLLSRAHSFLFNTPYEATSQLYMGQEQSTASPETQRKGQQRLQQGLQQIESTRKEMFEGTSRGGQSPRAAAQMLQQTQALKQGLQNNDYGFSEERRKRLQARITANEQYFRRIASRGQSQAAPARRIFTQAARGALNQEQPDYDTAVDAGEGLRKLLNSTGQQQQNASPFAPEQSGQGGGGI